MATPYATVADLEQYLGVTPPDDGARLLARAQERVDAALTSSFFETDANGNPTDSGVLAGLNKAVCAQVAWWISTGDEFDQLDQYSSWSIEGISATRDPDSLRRLRLCPDAYDALRTVITGVQFASALVPGKPTI